MALGMIVFVFLAIALRLAFLMVSVRNEKSLRARGAVEFGASTTRLLAVAHVAYYIIAAAEGLTEPASFTSLSLAGIFLYGFAMVMLLLVVSTLGSLWTVKLLVLPQHPLVRTGLYRWIRHPNYLLNILPELIGYGLVLQAFNTLLIGLPVYLIILALRIQQEDKAMKTASFLS